MAVLVSGQIESSSSAGLQAGGNPASAHVVHQPPCAGCSAGPYQVVQQRLDPARKPQAGEVLLVDAGKVGRAAGPVDQGVTVYGLQFGQLELQQDLDAMAQVLGWGGLKAKPQH